MIRSTPPLKSLDIQMNNQSQHSRIGLTLFAVYLAFYGGFVLLAGFAPKVMERKPFAGVNLAIWYGLALIVVAFALALVYGWARRGGRAAKSGNTPTESSRTGDRA
jgi:uncharacterized membrane protein (DUF485 family)